MGNSQGDLVQELAGELAEKPWGELGEAFQEVMEEAQEKIGGTLGEEPVVERVCIVLHRSTSFYILLHHTNLPTSSYIVLQRSTSVYIVLYSLTSW